MPADPNAVPAPLIPKHDPYAAFRSPDYRCYAIGNLISSLGRQMLGVGIIFEVYARTNSGTALGLTGLMGALPIVLLSLPAGAIADRVNRKHIVLATQLLSTVTSVGLFLLAIEHLSIPPISPLPALVDGLYRLAGWFGEHAAGPGIEGGVTFDRALPLMYLLLLINGVARAFGWAARGALFPNLVPRESLSNAVMWNSSNFELTCVIGPALGGLVIARFGTATVYAIDAICALACLFFIMPIRAPQERSATTAHPLRDFFGGLHFVFQQKVILATITLDMFAVLLGGAIAILPMFTSQILHVGAIGLGWLRAAPSIGAVTMAFALAHRPPLRKAGNAMLLAVAGFGAATIVFGLSRSYTLSFVALVLTGACDNNSVVVRHTLVQVLTPDAMRGRVSAVNNIFIGSSNELGALESGLTAARFGPVLSVVGGGIGTILVVLGICWKWPQVRRLGPLQAPTPTE